MRKTFIIGLLAIGFAFGFAGASALQEGEMGGGHEGGGEMGPPPPLEDPVADQYVGNWKWEGTMWHEGQEMPFVAEEKIQWALGHQFLIHKYQSFMPDGTVAYDALGVGRADPETGTTKLYWFDNHGVVNEFDGKRTETGEEGISEGPQGKMKSAVTRNEDGTMVHTMWMMPAGGGEEWVKMFETTGKKGAMGKGHMKGGHGGDGKDGHGGEKPGDKGGMKGGKKAGKGKH